MTQEKLYFDEPVVASFFCGELGWYLQRYQAYFRFLKQDMYPNHKFIIMTDLHLHVFQQDFVHTTIKLPQWFYDYKLERDCYDAPQPEYPAGALTPPEVYTKLIEYLRTFYNKEKAVEIWSPRGCDYWVDSKTQLFCKYITNPLPSDRPVVTVFPRYRERASNRNVPPSVWFNVVENLKKTFTVVLAGTPNGACLGDYQSDNVINLINYDEEDKTEKVIQWLNTSVCSISSQSGGTHISLLSGCPSYIIGHERDRHCVKENRLQTPTTFRQVPGDYRAISAELILTDVGSFLEQLRSAGMFEKVDRPSLRNLQDKKDLVGVEIGVFKGENSSNILRNLDIKHLYLVDPYISYAGNSLEIATSEQIKDVAYSNLTRYENKITWIHKKSNKAYKDIPDELDFVYIDGDHRYEAVKQDLELYFPKIKDGGLIAGHDFDKPDANNGVVEAVMEFAEKHNLKVFSGICKDDSRTQDWWIFKGDLVNVIAEDETILQDLIAESKE